MGGFRVTRRRSGRRVVLFGILLALALLLAPASLGAAFDRVIVNSGDWHDVYSGMLYASLEGVPSNFLVSTKHGAILPYSIPTTEDDQFVVTGRAKPYVVGYAGYLQTKGYANARELLTRNANFDLAELLTNVTQFIIIDPAYGYNAISVAPYAAVSKQYVLFADRRNIDDIVSFLADRDPTAVIIFGQVDREVKERLARFNPEMINKGDRFTNNMVMVDRYLAIKPTKQVVLTNGEFLEAGLVSGSDPVLFIGRANVPESIRGYIQKSDFEVGILIGNELIGTATFIRRQLGISVFVKFAQGARVPTGTIAQVEDLDRFPMPRYDLQLEYASIVYNRATRSLEVTYHNPTGMAEYFSSTITITLPDGTMIVVGDNEPWFLDKGEYKTIVYTTDTNGEAILLDDADGELTAKIFTTFGEGPKSLENAIEATLRISFVDIKDEALINITRLWYDKNRQAFIVTIENTGGVDAYVMPEMIDLSVNDELLTVAAEETVLLKKGGSARIQR